MKPERNTERKYYMQVMSTTTTKWKFRFTKRFVLVLFRVNPVIFWAFLNAHSAISESLTFTSYSILQAIRY